MRPHRIFRCFRSDADDNIQQKQRGISGKCRIFRGNDENLMSNGETLLERISLFDGRTNPMRCFSVDDLNSMNVNNLPYIEDGGYNIHAGVWDGNSVMVKIFPENHTGNWTEERRKQACREIAVATQMGTHSNVHRLLGFCLVTNSPILVYEWAENGTLADRILKYKDQNKEALDWLDRLRIAWEIAHAVAYLHTAFHQPIIHRDLKPSNVFLDQDDSARLSDFSFAILIPKGEKDVEDYVMGTVGYVAPEYLQSGRLAESADVFAFGALLLVLVSGKPPYREESSAFCFGRDRFVELLNANGVGGVVDQEITTNGALADENFKCHLKAFIGLALRCLDQDEESRPTMVEVATELKSMVMSSPASL